MSDLTLEVLPLLVSQVKRRALSAGFDPGPVANRALYSSSLICCIFFRQNLTPSGKIGTSILSCGRDGAKSLERCFPHKESQRSTFLPYFALAAFFRLLYKSGFWLFSNAATAKSSFLILPRSMCSICTSRTNSLTGLGIFRPLS